MEVKMSTCDFFFAGGRGGGEGEDAEDTIIHIYAVSTWMQYP